MHAAPDRPPPDGLGALVARNRAQGPSQLGDWDDVFAAFEKAARLDPRSAQLFFDLGGFSYHLVHRYADAVHAYDRALSLAPDLHVAAVWRGSSPSSAASLLMQPPNAPRFCSWNGMLAAC